MMPATEEDALYAQYQVIEISLIQRQDIRYVHACQDGTKVIVEKGFA